MNRKLQYVNAEMKKKLEGILPEKISDTQIEKNDAYLFISSVMIAVVNILFVKFIIKLLVTKKIRWR